MDPLILPLNSTQARLADVGGKGMNLARLRRAGFSVPGGFLITTAAYRIFSQANAMEGSIHDNLEGLDLSDPEQLTQASQKIRRKFSNGLLPEDLKAQIEAAYRPLLGVPLAVRSSATAEDLPDMSFAGQQDTFLNVIGFDALQQAVIDCWGSLWTRRAIGYRARNGIAQEDVALAVVVQQMIQSEASGVLFTANPLNGIRHQTAIDATLGLGEALVGGHVEPDNYLVDSKSGTILRKSLGKKDLVIRSTSGGGVEKVRMEAAERQAVPDETILALAALGQQVEAEYDFPQDIEWATQGGEIYLLQSRPITSLFPLPDLPDDKLRVFFSFGAVQGILDPLTPLGQDTIRLIFAGGASLFGYDVTHETQGVIKIAGERLWGEMTPIIRNSIGKQVAPKVLSIIEPSLINVVGELADDPRLAPEKKGLRLITIGRLLSFFLPNILTVLKTWADPDSRREKVLAISEIRREKFREQARQIESSAAGDIWKIFEDRLELYREIRSSFPHVIPNEAITAMAGLILLNVLHRLAKEAGVKASGGGISDLVLEISRGLPHNVTTEMDLILWETAQTIRQDPETHDFFESQSPDTLAESYKMGKLPSPGQQAIKKFMDRYGMRGVGEIDFGRSRWREDPTPIMETLKSYIRIPTESAPDVVFRRGEQAAERAVKKLAEKVRGTFMGRVKANVIIWAASRFRALAGLRESPKFHIVGIMGIFRPALLASGQDLVEIGVLDDPSDVFFLYFNELKELARQRPNGSDQSETWKTLVLERRERRKREFRRKQIPRLMLSDGQVFYEGLGSHETEGEAGVIVGSPVSPGMTEGKVRVVFNPHSADLQPGEILVCPGTDPAWTPLFLAAGGLVMEVGGMMTHGSVVAREYGIPAVVSVHQATTRLQTGMRIRVDGSAGRIEILDGSHPSK